MKVVIDSNVLLISIGKKSHYKPIWESFIAGKYQLVISNEIIHEYEEILLKHSAPGAAVLVMEILSESPDVIYKRTFYSWNAISEDPDDNKFFDVAVAGNIDFLVTNDNHFNKAKKAFFPKVNIISAKEFLEIILRL